MHHKPRYSALRLLAVAWLLAGLLVAGPAPAQDEAQLTPFLPQPESVMLQLTGDFPERGNVRVLVQLGAAEIEELRAETGRSDFLVIGLGEAQVLLRDDGAGADDAAGDGLFTGLGTADTQELVDKANDDETALTTASRESTEIPAFDGRSLVGSAEATAFDDEGFLSGKVVRYNPSVELEEPDSLQAEATPKALVASDGQMVAVTAAAGFTPGTNVFQDRVLMIRHLGVVQDPTRTYDPCTNTGNPDGPWAFKRLMTDMANQADSGIAPEVFVERWLDHWLSAQTVNTFNVPARTTLQPLINAWRQGGPNLDLDRSPLRLLAIVPRLDLAKTTGGPSGYGGASTGDFVDAGEARFVFGFVVPPDFGVDPNQFIAPVPIGSSDCHALPFTVILEFKVPKCNCREVRDWARQWTKLRNLTPGSSSYNAHLERLTRQFARVNADPTRPNGSSIGQVRTNEVALAAPWELREFQLTQKPFSFLHETTTADTPHDSFNGTATFDQWVLGNIRPNLPNIPQVPLLFNGNPFLASNPQVPDFPGSIVHHWNGAALNLFDPLTNQARHRASLAACNACHRAETETPFVMVDPTDIINPAPPPISNPSPSDASLPAHISHFLTGVQVADPAHGSPTRTFDDLMRREIDIKRKARMPCFRFHPFHRAHVLSTLRATGQLPPDPFKGLEPLPIDQQLSVAIEPIVSPPITEVH